MKVVKSCLSCRVDFSSYPSQNRQFCSRDCLRQFCKTDLGSSYKSQKIQATKDQKGTRKVEIRHCKHCSQPFQTLHSETKAFCKPECRYQHISENKDSMLQKQHATNIIRYGYQFPTQNKQIIESIRQTAAERYGSNHPRFSSGSMQKRVQTCITKYGKPYAPSFCSQSKDEGQLVELVRKIDPTLIIEENNRTLLGGREVDLYIPAKNLALEYDGLYYHSELRIANRRYHLDKTEALAKQGIRLVHIFSDEWYNKRDLVESKIAALIQQNQPAIYARKCEIKSIDAATSGQFLESYHIQGADKSKYKLGLYYQGGLVAVMTFSVGRVIMGSQKLPGKWELSRFATSQRVIGGAGKLLSCFIKQHHPTEIISYADRRWSVGRLYESLGFEKVGYSAPSYWYTKDYRTRLYRYNFRKSVLVANGCDPNKTEWEIMQDLGYDRIWDCGTIKYKMKI